MKKPILLLCFVLAIFIFPVTDTKAETNCGFFEKIFSNSCEQKKELENLRRRMNAMETYQNCISTVMTIFDEDRLFAEAYCKRR
jgi:hypothetical protein